MRCASECEAEFWFTILILTKQHLDKQHKYDLHPLPVRWLDGLKIARRAWPQFAGNDGHELDTLASFFGTRFQHHNAVEDRRVATLIALRVCREIG